MLLLIEEIRKSEKTFSFIYNLRYFLNMNNTSFAVTAWLFWEDRNKRYIHPKLKFDPFTTHQYVDGGHGDPAVQFVLKWC